MRVNEMTQSTIIQKLSDPAKIIVAADESPKSMGKRLQAIGVENTFDNRLQWRRIITDTIGFGKYVCGMILHPEILENMHIRTALQREGVAIIVKIDNGTDDNFSANQRKMGI